MLAVELDQSAALGGDLLVQASVPTEIHIDGFPAVELFREGEVRLPLETGTHALVVWRNGNPEAFEVSVPAGSTDVVLVVGRTGITTNNRTQAKPAADADVAVELRVLDGVELLVVIDGQRYRVEPGSTLPLTLKPGAHPMTVRSADGTVVWAQGDLVVEGDLVVQLSDGRLPEVPGGNGRFRPNR